MGMFGVDISWRVVFCHCALWSFVGRQSFVYLGLFEMVGRGIWDGS